MKREYALMNFLWWE